MYSIYLGEVKEIKQYKTTTTTWFKKGKHLRSEGYLIFSKVEADLKIQFFVQVCSYCCLSGICLAL